MTTVEREIDAPHIVERELMCAVREALLTQPRSLQQEIGASEVGSCIRKVIRSLAYQRLPDDKIKWKAFIGTCVHAGLASAIENCSWNTNVEQKRYLVEHEVDLATVRGRVIKGHVDVFDIDAATVIDWKVVGESTIAKAKTKGPSRQYQLQAHLYGRGFAQLSYAVRHVMIVYLPREKDLTIDKHGVATGSFVWSQAYDECVAEQALSRIAGLLDLLDIMSADELVEMYPLCDDYFCDWCTRDRMRQRNNQGR